MITVELLTKEECSLCDKAKKIIRSVQQVRSFRFLETDITNHPHLYNRYKEIIPVVRIKGEDIFRYKLSERALIKKLDNAEKLKG